MYVVVNVSVRHIATPAKIVQDAHIATMAAPAGFVAAVHPEIMRPAGPTRAHPGAAGVAAVFRRAG